MPTSAESPNLAGARARILVCDDAATVRSLMASLLGRRYELLLTATAEEALERAPSFSPDLVISDLLLPGISGRELLRRLRAIPAFAEVPMILFSALGDGEARAAGLESGADDYLVKPLRERELLARVASLLRLRHTLLALSQRSRELEEANAALRNAQERLVRAERLAALGSLAAQLAHDINNPLSLVRSGAAALVAITADARCAHLPLDAPHFHALLDELQAVAAELDDGSRRILAVGRDLQLFGAAEAGETARVPALDAVRSAVALARARSGEPGAIEVRAPVAPALEAPAHLVTLALLSLVDRAIVAAGPEGHVALEVSVVGTDAEIVVCDDGPPIPTADLPHVFEPFAAVHGARPGAGLGLPVAAGIVQGLGGSIDLDPGYAAGTCFRVRLPLARPGT